VKRWLRLAASLGLLSAAFYVLDWRAMELTLRKVSAAGLISAFAATLPIFAVLGWRWHLIVQPVAPQPPIEHLRHYLFGTFLNTLTPANLGGDVYRVLSLRPQAPAMSAVIVAVLRERALGLLAYFVACAVLAAASALGNRALPALVGYAGVVTALGAAALLLVPRFVTAPLLGMKWIRDRPAFAVGIELFDRAMRFQSLKQFVTLFALSVLGVALWVGAVALVARDLGMSVALSALGLVVVLTELLRMLPITVQGLGLREVTFAFLLGLMGSPAEASFVVGAVSYLVLTCTLIACGLTGWLLTLSRRMPSR